MFIIILTYQKDLTVVEAYLAQHRAYLDEHYASGCFIASGRQEPRIGGVILARASRKEEVEEVVQRDPFFQHGIASYQIIEFIPTKHCEAFVPLIE